MSSAGNSYSVFATPNQIKAAKEAEQELALSASKIKGLFEFLVSCTFSPRCGHGQKALSQAVHKGAQGPGYGLYARSI